MVAASRQMRCASPNFSLALVRAVLLSSCARSSPPSDGRRSAVGFGRYLATRRGSASALATTKIKGMTARATIRRADAGTVSFATRSG